MSSVSMVVTRTCIALVVMRQARLITPGSSKQYVLRVHWLHKEGKRQFDCNQSGLRAACLSGWLK